MSKACATTLSRRFHALIRGGAFTEAAAQRIMVRGPLGRLDASLPTGGTRDHGRRTVVVSRKAVGVIPPVKGLAWGVDECKWNWCKFFQGFPELTAHATRARRLTPARRGGPRQIGQRQGAVPLASSSRPNSRNDLALSKRPSQFCFSRSAEYSVKRSLTRSDKGPNCSSSTSPAIPIACRFPELLPPTI